MCGEPNTRKDAITSDLEESGHRVWFDPLCILLRYLGQQTLPDFHGNAADLVDHFSVHTGSGRVGRAIYEALQSHFGPDASNVTEARTNVSHSFARNEVVCTLVEWRDLAGVRFLAIFELDPNDPGRCSYLMQTADHSKSLGTGNSFQIWVYWNLFDFSAMTTLIGAAQHVVGILGLEKRDLDVLYCGNRKDTCSEEEYTLFFASEILILFSMKRYARLLFRHFVRIALVKSTVESELPLLETKTSIEGEP
jgi:hypothetical protein